MFILTQPTEYFLASLIFWHFLRQTDISCRSHDQLCKYRIINIREIVAVPVFIECALASESDIDHFLHTSSEPNFLPSNHLGLFQFMIWFNWEIWSVIADLLNWPSNVFLIFLMKCLLLASSACVLCFHYTNHPTNLSFIKSPCSSSPCYNVSYYNYNFTWPYYIVIHITWIPPILFLIIFCCLFTIVSFMFPFVSLLSLSVNHDSAI